MARSPHPFATMQHAMISLEPGDTLDVESGKYPGFIVGWDSTPASSGDPYGYINGTPGNPITIQAEPGSPPGSVIIDSRNNETPVGIDLEPGDNYINISGFTIDGLAVASPHTRIAARASRSPATTM